MSIIVSILLLTCILGGLVSLLYFVYLGCTNGGASPKVVSRFCTKCSWKNRGGSRFCAHCGSILQ